MKNLLILVVLIFGTGCFAQSIKISGLITDKNSGQPIAAASIKLPDGTGISSGTNGKFEIRITRLPIKLKIRHVSYQTKEIDLITDPKSLVRIELEELVSEIREVNISAQRLKNLTENEDFTLQDFAFDKNHLWLLGYMKNNPLRGRLWIADAFGDTITSIPIRKPEKLYTDLFGNVQLVMSDTVYQVYSDGKAMVFAYPYEKAQFFKTITPIKAIFAGKPVYQDYVHWKQGLHTYYYSQADQKSYFLNIARDSAEEVRQLIDYIYGENRWIINGTRSKDPEWREKCVILYAERRRTRDTVSYQNVRVPLFTFGDSLFVINLYKDSLLTYSPEGKFARAIPIKFHQDSLLFDVLFRDLTYLTDPVSQRMYLLQRKTTAWKLNEFNPSAGRVGKQVQLPDFPGMSGITIYDHAVYFLYPEKKYPNYVRLYRYTI
jgi:hypothetical protein